jgi:hypothetical protein
MRFVIAAMLSQRLDDIFAATAQRSRDALEVMQTRESGAFSNVSPQQAMRLVAEYPSKESWFLAWKELFVRALDQNATPDDLPNLTDSDPIIGWTAANVLRRIQLDDEMQMAVRDLAQNSNSKAVRWRSVHVLGAFPNPANVDVLFDRMLADSYEWVAYGALRSLMEIAAVSQQLRDVVLSGIFERIELLEQRPRLREEFSRAVFARDLPDRLGWLRAVGRIVRDLASRSTDVPEYERWIRLGSDLEAHFAA